MANITLNDIIRAIDIIICRNDLFTDEQLASVFNNNKYIAKAAQAVMQRKNINPQQPQSSRSKEKMVMYYLRRGFPVKEISQNLNVDLKYINLVAQKYQLNTPSLRNQWYQETYESPVRELSNKVFDYEITVDEIAQELNVHKKMVQNVLTKAGINLKKLSDDRRAKQIEQLRYVVLKMIDQGIDTSDVAMQKEYFDHYQILLSTSTVRRLKVLGNIPSSKYRKKDNFVDIIDHWIWSNDKKSIANFINTHAKDRDGIYKAINAIFNQIIEFSGKYYNLDVSNNTDMQSMRDLIMTRLQVANIISDRHILQKQEDFKNNEQYKNLQEYRVDPKITVDQFKEKYKPINPRIRPNFEKELIKEKERRQMANKSNNWYKLAKEYDKLPGGRGEGKHPSDFPKDQVNRGIEIEIEHGTDKDQATEIALDHLTEFDDYYTGLDEMEKKLKEKHKNKQ